MSLSKGVHQGSVLSPELFCISINDLLGDLDSDMSGLRLGNMTINNFAYANDVTVFSSTITGLQFLINNKCSLNENIWRFSFSIE